MTFSKDLRISGYRPAVFKNGLRAFHRTRTRGNFIALKSVFDTGRDGAIVFEECLDRGLIGVEAGLFVLTDAGEAIARGKARKRTPLPQALEVLNKLMDRAALLNSDPGGIGYVDQIWLFGSVMRGEPEVGDIDLAMITSRRPEHQGNWTKFEELIDQRMDEHPDAPERLRYWWGGESWLRDNALYGKRRHPLLSGVQDGTSDLQQMGVPCRLIFDRQRGGRVWDETLPRHPESLGRSNSMAPPGSMPDLKPQHLAPMDANWVSGFNHRNGQVHPRVCFGEWTDEARTLFPFYPREISVASIGNKHDAREWVPKLARRSDLDGRERAVIFDYCWRAGLGLILRRQIVEEPGRQLLVRCTDQEILRVRSNLSPMLEHIGATIAMIVSADAERICRRYREAENTNPIGVDIDLCSLNGPLRKQLHEWLEAAFIKRLVHCTPAGWEGPRVTVTVR